MHLSGCQAPPDQEPQNQEPLRQDPHYECDIAAKGWEHDPGHRLHLVFIRGRTSEKVMWMAAHAPAGASFRAVLSDGRPVFRSRSDILTVTKERQLDWRDEASASWVLLGNFDTNILPAV